MAVAGGAQRGAAAAEGGRRVNPLERTVGSVLHDHEELLRLDEAVVVAHDERVVERRQNVRLLQHGRGLLRVTGQLELLERIELVVGLATG